MVSIDWSLVFQLVNYLVLIAVLNIVLYKPIRGIIRKRREKISSFEADISNLAQQARSRGEEVEERLAEARKAGFNQKDELKNAGLENEKKIITVANMEAEAAVQKIKEQISREITSAREALKGDLEVFSRELAQKILGRSLS